MLVVFVANPDEPEPKKVCVCKILLSDKLLMENKNA